MNREKIIDVIVWMIVIFCILYLGYYCYLDIKESYIDYISKGKDVIAFP